MLSILVLSDENRLLIMRGSPHLYRWGRVSHGDSLEWHFTKLSESTINEEYESVTPDEFYTIVEEVL